MGVWFLALLLLHSVDIILLMLTSVHSNVRYLYRLKIRTEVLSYE